MYFTIYMRWILCPLSLYTWANLNHTLCGIENDPFYAIFNLDENYYGLAEIYLMLCCYLGIALNFIVVGLLSRLLCIVQDK